MRVYLLVPLHTSDPVWMFSMQCEPVQVVAPSESEARLRASLRYARRRTGERSALRDPWLDSRWVYAHPIEKTDPAMPLIAWDPVPPRRSAPAQDVPTLLQQPEGPRGEGPRR